MYKLQLKMPLKKHNSQFYMIIIKQLVVLERMLFTTASCLLVH